MHHIPKPQDQARILETALKSLDLHLPHQTALQVIAKVMGYKDWKTMSAASKEALAIVEAPPVVERAPAREPEIRGPADGKLYESLVTVDMTLSARIQVRAYDEAQAEELLREAGHAQYPTGFEVDENYRGPSDFYMGDPDSITCLTPGQVEYDSDGDYWGTASWEEDGLSYKICASRPNSDNSDEELWAEVEVSLHVTHANGVTVAKTLTDYEVHSDNLADWIEECIDNGDFDDEFSALDTELDKKVHAE